MGGHSKEKPVGEGKKEELAVPLALCSSVGGGALTNIHGTAVLQLPPRHATMVR